MSSSRNGLVQDDFGGFIDDDMSGGMGSSASVDIDTSNNIAGMEREIYIDGKMHLTKKGKKLVKDKEKGKKKSNGYGSDVLGLFRVFWATRQTEDIDKVRNPDHYVKVTLRELAIYSIFLIIICLSKLIVCLEKSLLKDQVFRFEPFIPFLYTSMIGPNVLFQISTSLTS